VAVSIESGDWGDAAAMEALVTAAALAATATMQARLHPDSELSIVLTDDQHMRALNRRFRGQDKPTNVLAFPIDAPDAEAFGPLLGDVVIAAETVAAEAAAAGIPAADHVSHLVVHGVLHLFGYDHHIEADAERMERMESAILAELGVPDPHAPSAAGMAATEPI
jgi:probable rRNA maturation factor